MSHCFSQSVRPSQYASCEGGLGLSLWGVGSRRVITIGAWSDPLEGRDDVSQERNEEHI